MGRGPSRNAIVSMQVIVDLHSFAGYVAINYIEFPVYSRKQQQPALVLSEDLGYTSQYDRRTYYKANNKPFI
jgi:hypothetical protein